MAEQTDAGAPPRLLHDRVTWLVYTQLGIYGYFLYGFGPAVPLLRLDQDVSRGVSGLHGTALAVGTLLSGAVFAALAARLGRGALMWASLAGLCAGVLLLCATTALPVTLSAALICGFFGSMVVSGSSAILADHHGAAGPAAISEANAMGAALGLTAPLMLGLAVTVYGDWRPGLLLTVVLTVIAAAGLGRTGAGTPALRPAGAAPGAPAPGAPAPGAPGSPERGGGTRLPRAFWVAWVTLLLFISVEFCMTIWSSDLLVTRLDAAPGVAASGVTALVAGMLAGRLAGGRLALVVAPPRLLLAAIAVAAGGFTVFWLSPALWVAFVGLAVTGLGMSLHFPLGVARAIAMSRGLSDLAVARSSWAAGLAVGVAPFALGALADLVGTSTAFLIVPLLLAAAAGAVRLGNRGAEAASLA